MRRRRFAWMAAVSAIALAVWPAVPTSALAAAQAPAPAHANAPGRLALIPVSNPRPELVSGGEVLIRVEVPARTRAADVRITADGHDVTASFQAQPDGTLLGLVTGLRVGRNRLVATAPRQFASLRVDDHPSPGRSSPARQQLPFFCQTTSFGLAASVQPDCSAPTRFPSSTSPPPAPSSRWPIRRPARRPGDRDRQRARPCRTSCGSRPGRSTAPSIRPRRCTTGKAPSPLQPDTSWNGKLIYTFGGGCNAGFHQGTSTGGVLDDEFLSQGYAVASSTLNVLDNNCSTIISAEAAMMVKEHFIDTYGPVRFTIGWGGSGGAIQQYEIADSYPGILDGIIPSISFPDPLTTAGPVTDCRLLDQFFAGRGGSSFTPAQQTAIAGYNDYTTCKSWDATFANRATATGSCNSAIPPADQWNAVTNPDGIICNSNEQIVNQLGIDPTTGFPNSPWTTPASSTAWRH